MAYKNQDVYSGFESYVKIKSIIKKTGARKPLLVCDSAYKFLFIKEYIESLDIPFVFFDDFTPNPLYEDIIKGVALYRSENCDMIVSIGGGSAIDVAKCIKLFAKMPDSEVYLKQEYADTGILHLAIPTTAGTGSEATRFAVCYYEGAKQSVSHESIIPDFVILEPKFLETLPDYQKKATLLDALCQAIESLWSVNSTDESIEYSRASIRMILANLYAYLRNDKEALSNISLAANLAGKAINISQTTAAHAMSYKITSLCGLAHGHAVAVCLPYVWRYMIENTDKCSDLRGIERLRSSFDVLNELFYVDMPQQAVYRFFRLLKYLEMDFPTLQNDKDIEVMITSVNPERLRNNPVGLSEEAITEIYNNVFRVGNKFQIKYIDKFLRKYNTRYEVKELQEFALDVLKKVDYVCKNNGIEYYLLEGTLLGAVRHQGFIPWDDDIDIGMKREDYDRFIAVAPKELGNEYVLDSFETNPKHWTICAKVLKTAKTKFSNKRLEGIGLSTSPGIDIFPLDMAPESEATMRKIGNRIKIYKIMLWLKTGYSHDYSTVKYALLKLSSLFLTTSFLHKKINKLMRKHNAKTGDKLVNYGSLYPAEKECFKCEDFSESLNVKFEDMECPVPAGYDSVLKTVYGDYQTLPPYSKRFPKHSFLVDKNF